MGVFLTEAKKLSGKRSRRVVPDSHPWKTPAAQQIHSRPTVGGQDLADGAFVGSLGDGNHRSYTPHGKS